MNFCTLFDSKYLDRGIALCKSLNFVENELTIYVFAFDNIAFQILNEMKIANVILIREEEFLDSTLLKIKEERSRTEYCWTCTPVIIQYAIEHFKIDHCIYIDADMYFYQSPKILFEEIKKGKGDVSVISHRFPENIEKSLSLKHHGLYCVEFNTFFNNDNGMRILDDWKQKCLNACSMEVGNGSFGDQLYLNHWPKRFEGVYELVNKGAGVAPWNLSDYKLLKQKENNFILKYKKSENCQLIFYHFQGVRFINDKYVNINVYNTLGKFDAQLVKKLYDSYIKEIINIRRFLKENYMLEIKNPENRKSKSNWKYTGMKDLIVYILLSLNNVWRNHRNKLRISKI